MGRVKTHEERMAKRLAVKEQIKNLQAQEQSERDETKPRHEKVIRRPATDPSIVNFGQDSLRQKKG